MSSTKPILYRVLKRGEYPLVHLADLGTAGSPGVRYVRGRLDNAQYVEARRKLGGLLMLVVPPGVSLSDDLVEIIGVDGPPAAGPYVGVDVAGTRQFWAVGGGDTSKVHGAKPPAVRFVIMLNATGQVDWPSPRMRERGSRFASAVAALARTQVNAVEGTADVVFTPEAVELRDPGLFNQEFARIRTARSHFLSQLGLMSDRTGIREFQPRSPAAGDRAPRWGEGIGGSSRGWEMYFHALLHRHTAHTQDEKIVLGQAAGLMWATEHHHGLTLVIGDGKAKKLVDSAINLAESIDYDPGNLRAVMTLDSLPLVSLDPGFRGEEPEMVIIPGSENTLSVIDQVFLRAYHPHQPRR